MVSGAKVDSFTVFLHSNSPAVRAVPENANGLWKTNCINHNDVIMSAMASQITSLTIVYSTVYSDADQKTLRKHQSPALLAFVWGIHLWPVNSPHKGPVMQKTFPFDDVIVSYRSHGPTIRCNLPPELTQSYNRCPIRPTNHTSVFPLLMSQHPPTKLGLCISLCFRTANVT